MKKLLKWFVIILFFPFSLIVILAYYIIDEKTSFQWTDGKKDELTEDEVIDIEELLDD